MSKIYSLDGVYYVDAGRKAVAGDLIIITRYDGAKAGVFARVKSEDFMEEDFYADAIGETSLNLYGDGVLYVWVGYGDQYTVLVPREDITPARSDRDLIVELAYSFAKLQREVDELKAESKRDADLHEKVEMLIEDVSMLDERTQPLTDEGLSQLSTDLASEVERTVSRAMRNGR